MAIRQLPIGIVDQLADGVAIETPANAVKELIENSLDSGARRIDVQVDGGGLTRILVEDDGDGIPAHELPLTVARHATSRLVPSPDGHFDLQSVSTLGFRGDALAEIGQVASLQVTSRSVGVRRASTITVDAGVASEVEPADFSGSHGARVEVRNLFRAHPERLRSLGSERAESQAAAEAVRRAAMANPAVAFSLDLNGRRSLRLEGETDDEAGRLARLTALLGTEFAAGSRPIDQERDGVRLFGFVALLPYSTSTATQQYLFVNGRPVEDQLLQRVLRAAYVDLIVHGHHPTAVLNLSLDPSLVDFNIHPAKAEVRFHDPDVVRGLIISGLRHALADAGPRDTAAPSGNPQEGSDRAFRAGPAAVGLSAWRAGAWTPSPQLARSQPSDTPLIGVEDAPAQKCGLALCVLPFVNMGDDAEQEYFSDGISEDIITNLAKITALAVVARNTAFTFKGRSVDVAEVAQRLNVSHVLEGSVRKSGGRVRITAQLIEGTSGAHVWAERYDRDLTDIFAVQDEIAETIVSALKLQLLPQEKAAIEQHGTLNVDAYNLYLMARDYYVRGHQGNLRRMETVVRLCGQATEIDPGYARAWTLMAWGKEALRFFFGDPGADIMAIVDRSLSLDADQAEAHALKATHLLLAGKSNEAADELNLAIRLDPDSYRVNLAAARFCFSQARFTEAIPFFEKVADMDEGNFSASTMVLACHRALGNMEGAIRAAQITFARAERALQRDQSDCGAMAAGAGALGVLGEAERARSWMTRALFMEPDSIVMRYNFACALSSDLADIDGAIELLGPTFAAISPDHLAYANTDPDLDPLREDPRFQAMVAAAEARLGEASVPMAEAAG